MPYKILWQSESAKSGFEDFGLESAVSAASAQIGIASVNTNANDAVSKRNRLKFMSVINP